MTFMISYAPRGDRQNVELKRKVQQFPSWVILNDNTFFVSGKDLLLADVKTMLNDVCNEDSSYVVFRITRPGCARNISLEMDAWILRNIVRGDGTEDSCQEELDERVNKCGRRTSIVAAPNVNKNRTTQTPGSLK